jgi:hypothetical protein
LGGIPGKWVAGEMKTAGICLTFIYLASFGGYIAVVLECGQCLVFYGDLMDDGSVIAIKYETNGMVSMLMFLAKVRPMVVFPSVVGDDVGM